MTKTLFHNQRYTAFPLGGIGTGTISLEASGRLADFEIFNRPMHGNKLPYSFFAMHAHIGDKTDTRVLQAQGEMDFGKGRGYHPNEVHGLAHFEKSQMQVKYPFAHIAFEQPGLPLDVELTAFTPFIPLDADKSGMPVALFTYTVRNLAQTQADVMVCGSMPNFHDYRGFDCFDNFLPGDACKNEGYDQDGLKGVYFTSSAADEGQLGYANSALLTAEKNAVVQPYWYQGGWQDGVTMFWKAFSQGRLDTFQGHEQKGSIIGPKGCSVGSLAVQKRIAPGEAATFTFAFAWYVPNRLYGWFLLEAKDRTMKNYYATRHENALAVAKEALDTLAGLKAKTDLFSSTLYASTLPEAVIDALATSITVLRSNTCFRTADGMFYGWEGCHEQEGSCHGTCTHVWNYAQTAAFLFPELEKRARMNEFLLETDEQGKMCFRTQQSFGYPPFDMPPAADGQLGTIVRAYREFLLTGDQDYLEKCYGKMRDALAFAYAHWDKDGDGLLEAKQHNTYDIEFYGVNPLSGVLALAALRAMEESARVLNRPQDADAYREKFLETSVKLDAACYENGYYVQRSGDIDQYPYQFGIGCLTDQLLGQTLAYITGLGDLLPFEHIRHAAKAICDYNTLTPGQDRTCMQRLYIAPDEKGVRACSWPFGGEPKLPFVYSDEVWTGEEYQLATMLCFIGMEQEGIEIVKNVQARFDGNRRNPFNEMECGFHYARSMAVWGVLAALSGMELNASGQTTFAPKTKEDTFSSFYCDGRRWGVVNAKRGADKSWTYTTTDYGFSKGAMER